MSIWSGFGINYGHTSVTKYTDGTADSDIATLKGYGITKVRIAMPPFDSVNIQVTADLAKKFVQNGFYVIWGVGSYNGVAVDSTRWNNFLTTVPTVAVIAKNAGVQEFSIGNEEELHVDNTTITIVNAQANLRTLATTVKGVFSGVVSYQTAQTQLTNWVGNLGGIDKLGVNCYGTNSAFQTAINTTSSSFASNGYISEWGTSAGYPDFNNEGLWADELSRRMYVIRQTAIPSAYFFAARDGGYSITANTFALFATTGERQSFARITNNRGVYV